MSHRKDRERASQGLVFRDGELVKVETSPVEKYVKEKTDGKRRI